MASANDEFTSTLLGENLEVKGVVDKMFKKTFIEMIMHSYYTSVLNFVTDVRIMFNHCTEKKIDDDISRIFQKYAGERDLKAHAYHVGNVYLSRTDECYNDFSSNRIKC